MKRANRVILHSLPPSTPNGSEYGDYSEIVDWAGSSIEFNSAVFAEFGANSRFSIDCLKVIELIEVLSNDYLNLCELD